MKQYFKYSSGYVNINDENLFITRSGNWSETHTLEEKLSKTERANKRKKFKFDFLFFVLILCTAFIIYDAINGKMSASLPIGLVALVYVRNQTEKRIKIPLSKIITIEIEGNAAKIVFYNSSNEQDSEKLNKIELKGILILEQLSCR